MSGENSQIRNVLGLIRFSHTVFALPFALLAAVLAWAQPDSVFRWRDLLGIIACMALARAAAMAFNRLVDHRLDAANPRTSNRHLPAGLLSRRFVIIFTLACSLGFIAATLVFLPKRLPIILSVPVLLYLLSYSFTKRWTMLCHYWLSAALCLSPIAAWIAVRDTVELPAVLLASVVFFWVGGFDILYACQDFAFDRQAGLHSIPARLGIPRALVVARVSHIATVLCLLALWHYSILGIVFLTATFAIAVLLCYEHWLVSADDLSRVNLAFFHVNTVISLGTLIAGGIDMWLNRL